MANEGGEEERRDPAEINQRILRSFLPLRDTLSLPLAVGEGVLSRMHYGEAEGRHKTICSTVRRLHVSACTCLLYVPIGDKRPGAIHRFREAKWIFDKRILSFAGVPPSVAVPFLIPWIPLPENAALTLSPEFKT